MATNRLAKTLIVTYQGFTLIEVLITLTLFSLLLTLLLFGFRQGLIRWQQASQRQQFSQMQLSRYHWLQTLFQQTIVSDIISHQQSFLPYFKGKDNDMQFISAAPLLDVVGYPRPIELRLQFNQQNYDLYYREGLIHSDPARGLHWSNSWVKLLSSISNPHFNYQAPAVFMPSNFDKEDIAEMTAAEKRLYRNQAEWMSELDSEILFRMPQRIKFEFIDSQHQSHQWIFNLPTATEVWSLEAYSHEH